MNLVSVDSFLCPRMAHTWVDHSRRIIFCKIPKNAGTTIMSVLGLAYEQRSFHPVDPEDYFVFTLLRDPVERFFSGFQELCKRKSNVTVDNQFWRLSRTEDRVFSLVVQLEKMLDRAPYYFDPHIRPQWWFLTYDNGTMYRIDRYYDVANMKEIQSDFRSRQILPRLSPTTLLGMPRLNTSETEGVLGLASLRSNKELVARLQAIYAKDMELYKRAVSAA